MGDCTSRDKASNNSFNSDEIKCLNQSFEELLKSDFEKFLIRYFH